MSDHRDHQQHELRHWLRQTLTDLVAIPSVSAAGFDPDEVRRSAEAGAALLEGCGASGVRLLEIDGAHPAVFGEFAGPDGAPTVLLYAHHDVQPTGPLEQWLTPPFEATERDGRLYGRGTSDDKCGVAMHVGAMQMLEGKPPVGVKIFFEGEEEIGSLHLPDFLNQYGDDLAADTIVIADVGNLRVGEPALTTSLRGLVDCYVEVRVLESGVHSGMFGGVFPDALTTLAKILSTLHDDHGRPAIRGLVSADPPEEDMAEADLRQRSGALEETSLIGEGSLASRLWSQPSISVLAIDAPPVAEAINQLVPEARAKVSVRLAPGDDAQRASKAVIDHLEAASPWGAQVTVTPGAAADAFALDTSGAAYEAFGRAFTEIWQREPVMRGEGGTIPFVPAFHDRYPEASILLTGAADGSSHAHGPNESVDLDDLFLGTLAEVRALQLLAGQA